MSVDACAAKVASSDPDRFKAALTAPPDKRGDLLVLYAFNLEIARAPWVTAEPLIAEMRLQWWRDMLEEAFGAGEIRRHEVATPLGALIRDAHWPRAALDGMIDARARDISRAPPEDLAALQGYLLSTGGTLMGLAAARLIGQPQAPIAERLGYVTASADYLLAIPALMAAGREPLPKGDGQEMVRALAKGALGELKRLRGRRRDMPREAVPALLPAASAELVLKGAAQAPSAALEGALAVPEWRRRFLRLWCHASGRW